jgi:hypothetical protein
MQFVTFRASVSLRFVYALRALGFISRTFGGVDSAFNSCDMFSFILSSIGVHFAGMKKAADSQLWLLHATCFLLGLFFHPEDGGDMFLRNVG